MKCEPKAIDLFAGCGGLSFGLRAAGFNVISAVEKDSIAAGAYQLNHPNTRIHIGEIQSLNPYLLMKQLQLKPTDLDLLAGCPPCQGFSTLRTKNGKSKVRDERNALVGEIARFAKAFLPKAIMVENVPGLLGKRVFKQLKCELNKLGYSIRHAVEDVRFYGVPQRRRRLILIAGLGFKPEFARRDSTMLTVRDAIAHLQPPGQSGDLLHDFPERRSNKVIRLIKRVPKDGGGRLDLPKTLQLRCHKRTNGFKDIYGRLAWDAVAPTITTGCYNPSKGRFLHPEQDRCITMREAALLQGFPYQFKVPSGTKKTEAARMIGNALPPEFIRRHAKVLLTLVTQSNGTQEHTTALPPSGPSCLCIKI